MTVVGLRCDLFKDVRFLGCGDFFSRTAICSQMLMAWFDGVRSSGVLSLAKKYVKCNLPA